LPVTHIAFVSLILSCISTFSWRCVGWEAGGRCRRLCAFCLFCDAWRVLPWGVPRFCILVPSSGGGISWAKQACMLLNNFCFLPVFLRYLCLLPNLCSVSLPYMPAFFVVCWSVLELRYIPYPVLVLSSPIAVHSILYCSLYCISGSILYVYSLGRVCPVDSLMRCLRICEEVVTVPPADLDGLTILLSAVTFHFSDPGWIHHTTGCYCSSVCSFGRYTG
jgi:hypothetical protein